jgi:hypothetical protein
VVPEKRRTTEQTSLDAVTMVDAPVSASSTNRGAASTFVGSDSAGVRSLRRAPHVAVAPADLHFSQRVIPSREDGEESPPDDSDLRFIGGGFLAALGMTLGLGVAWAREKCSVGFVACFVGDELRR